MKRCAWLAVLALVAGCGEKSTSSGQCDAPDGCAATRDAGTDTAQTCELGAVRVGDTPCGADGSLEQVCEADGWRDTARCVDANACTDAEVRESGTPCGPNGQGRLQELCVLGTWSDTATCIDDDVCINDANQQGATTCGLNGAGVFLQSCDDGAWADTTTCLDEDVCTNGQSRPGATPCGANDVGRYEQTCSDGAWVDTTNCVTTPACTDGDTRQGSTACGLNLAGLYEQACMSGQWSDTANCVDDDVCTNGAEQPGTTACGPNLAGFLDQECVAGIWVNTTFCQDNDVCTDGTTRVGSTTCEVTGALEQTCTGGAWIDSANCVGGTPGAYAYDPVAGCWPLATFEFRDGLDGYQGTQDVELDQVNPASANAAATEIGVDVNSGSDQTQGLLKFTAIFGNNVGQMPLGVPIRDAWLTVRTTDSTSGNIFAHAMLSPWDENATWNALSGGVAPDHIEAHEAGLGLFFSPQDGDFSRMDVTLSVRDWSAATYANQGWALLGTSSNGWDFYTSDHATAAERPHLTVNVGDCGPPPDPNPDLTPVSCPTPASPPTSGSGLPLLQSNPGAPVALFLDFDGGDYHSHSSGTFTPYGAFNDSGSASSFDANEQNLIQQCWDYVRQYYAMFDVNVTTDVSALSGSLVWAWSLITDDASGGLGGTGFGVIGTEMTAHSYTGSSTVTGSDRCRRVAHEIGHNFQLNHNGVWDAGTFYKWEDWPQWDGVYGPIMGGGGEGDRNGWGYSHHEDDPVSIQDSMQMIRQRIMHHDPTSGGWSDDDFAGPDPAPFCSGAPLMRRGVLNDPLDVDVFGLDWAGGDLTITVVIPGVSAALVDVELVDDTGAVVGAEGVNPAIGAGTYSVRVRSRGGYGEIGEYEIQVD